MQPFCTNSTIVQTFKDVCSGQSSMLIIMYTYGLNSDNATNYSFA